MKKSFGALVVLLVLLLATGARANDGPLTKLASRNRLRAHAPLA